jgi:hypothetical protein
LTPHWRHSRNCDVYLSLPEALNSIKQEDLVMAVYTWDPITGAYVLSADQSFSVATDQSVDSFRRQKRGDRRRQWKIYWRLRALGREVSKVFRVADLVINPARSTETGNDQAHDRPATRCSTGAVTAPQHLRWNSTFDSRPSARRCESATTGAGTFISN